MSRVGDYLGRVTSIARALRMANEKARRARWSRDRLVAFQRARLGALVEYASRSSRFYRRLYGGPVDARQVELSQLPTVSKATMMREFDELVTDPRLTRAGVDAHLTRSTAGARLFGEYRTLASSGTTGLRGIYAFSPPEWDEVMASYFSCADLVGVRPTLPRQRVLVIAAPDARHISHQQSRSADIGLYRIRRQPVTSSLQELVDVAARFSPHGLIAYPSVLTALAREQLDARLRIEPKWIITIAELRTEGMTRQITAAWGVDPFTTFGMTEGASVASDCEAHAGLHVLEDGIILENVDRHGRPVPPGTPGSKLLLTNLWLRTQPLIRFEIDDMLAFDERPCACGRTTKRIVAVHGRRDDVLELPGADGRPVIVHPAQFRRPLGALTELEQYQLAYEPRGLEVRLVARPGTSPDTLGRTVRQALARVLEAAGVTGVTLTVHFVERLERTPAGKLELVARRSVPETAGPRSRT